MGLLDYFLSHRIHFVEIHDTEWCPDLFRNYLRDYLAFAWSFLNYYTVVVPVLSRFLKMTKSDKILDLCSGSGGPLPLIQKALKDENLNVSIQLTDLYPPVESMKLVQKEAKANGFVATYSADPVDATNCKLPGFRTLFGCFHHFTPELAQQILQNAVDTNSPIGVFEVTERSIFALLFFSIVFIVLAIPLSPFAKPRWNLGRIFWTSIIPVMPFMVAFDGFISCLRTYSLQEMRDLVAKLDGKEKFTWEIGTVKLWIFPNLVYLVGIPKDSIKQL